MEQSRRLTEPEVRRYFSHPATREVEAILTRMREDQTEVLVSCRPSPDKDFGHQIARLQGRIEVLRELLEPGALRGLVLERVKEAEERALGA